MRVASLAFAFVALAVASATGQGQKPAATSKASFISTGLRTFSTVGLSMISVM